LALLLFLMLVSGLSCGYRSQTSHAKVVGKYAATDKQRLWEAVLQTLDQKQIPIARKDYGSGIITSDSFPVTPAMVDCGKNLLGADYAGTRLGVLEIKLRKQGEMQIDFQLSALLTILANKKQVKCNSFGKLEKEILESVDLRLGLKRDQINGATP